MKKIDKCDDILEICYRELTDSASNVFETEELNSILDNLYEKIKSSCPVEDDTEDIFLGICEYQSSGQFVAFKVGFKAAIRILLSA